MFKQYRLKGEPSNGNALEMNVIDEARNEEFKKVPRQENSQNTEISGVSDVRLMDSRRNIGKGKVVLKG